MDELPFSQACENNKAPILAQLQHLLCECRTVLEIGAGTGQHATWFAGHMPWLRWQPTDASEDLGLLLPRCSAYGGDNLLPPRFLDVRQRPWPLAVPDAVYTANSLHIMAWSSVESLFAELGEQAEADTRLIVYGPFNYGGRYTSDSNARFDQWLARQHPDSAIRDFEQVAELAEAAGLQLEGDVSMPANNRLLAWRKT